MANIRTFIAFDTPPEFKRILSDIQSELRRTDADIRWEPPEKFHGTIKFLGDTNEDILPQISQNIRSVITRFKAIELQFDRFGCFPNERRPKILWVGCKYTDSSAEALKTELDKALLPYGFEPEERAFRPHITLGRFKSDFGAKHLISKAEKINFEPFTVPLREVVFLKSTLRPTGSLYTVLETFSLSLS